MPAALAASPAVVRVWTPSTKDRLVLGIGIGFQRSGAIGCSTSGAGAVRHSPLSIGLKSPQWATVGRMR